jgi:hypothetical protein
VINLAVVKKIGSSGQISLGKKYAGRDVIIEQISDDVWVIKTGEFIPHDEKWLHHPNVAKALDEAIDWAEQNPPGETSLNDLEEQLKNAQNKSGS